VTGANPQTHRIPWDWDIYLHGNHQFMEVGVLSQMISGCWQLKDFFFGIFSPTIGGNDFLFDEYFLNWVGATTN